MRDQYLRTGDRFILTYSVISRTSFEDIEMFVQQIYRIRDTDDFPLVLAGNKCDLEVEREVTSEEGKEYASRHSTKSFYETSAKDRYNVEEIFVELTRMVLKERYSPLGEYQQKKFGSGGYILS